MPFRLQQFDLKLYFAFHYPNPLSGRVEHLTDASNKRVLNETYVMLRPLGNGAYARVRLCREVASGQLFVRARLALFALPRFIFL